jgi:response regulator RpfG family c-di-GMP phosphodiesterase
VEDYGVDGGIAQGLRDQADRVGRLRAAFAETGIGSTVALEGVVARLYRNDNDGLSHLHRVTGLAVKIGRELEMGPDEVADLERAALLHDLGRLVLPDPPALAVSRHDAATQQRRAAQVQMACVITADVPFLWRAAAILAASVECFDGTGFPEGRRGEDIPLAARVLQLADTLDTLDTLCQALSAPSDAAGAEVVRQAGSRFDPEVVSAWLRSRTNVPASLVPWWSAPARWN